MNYLIDFIVFFAKTATLILAILILFAGLIAIASKGQEKGKIRVKKLNKKFTAIKNQLKQETLPKQIYKKHHKENKQKEKEHQKQLTKEPIKRLFVINFDGDIKASHVNNLTEEINAILAVATPQDEVVVRLESSGGLVHAYGLGASQLSRLRLHKIPLTVIVDKIAASGGYMMACVADKIIAAPFAIIGSIGVLAQIPNFHRLLKEHSIDFEQLTAGDYKRTLTLFGENTPKARQKLQEEIEEIHGFFKEFIVHNRPSLEIDQVATGEHWLGSRALELKLIDAVGTSDEYLLNAANTHDIYNISYLEKKNIADKLAAAAQMGIKKVFYTWQSESKNRWIA